MALYSTITVCRLCQSPALSEIMHFGEQYLASNFVTSNAGLDLNQFKAPLSVVLCHHCGVVQLRETVQRPALFQEYFYRSGTNPMMRTALQDVVDDVLRHVDIQPGDAVVDVGCNDATMLSFFPATCRRVGVEPSANINWQGLDPSLRIIHGFFTKTSVLQATGGARCKVVTSIAMLYSVEDINTFTAEVKALLAPDGLWCIQLSYLPATLTTMSFYDVCHEHLFYFSLRTLSFLLEKHGLTIVDASTNDVNGGSLRVFATHQERHVPHTARVDQLLHAEDNMALTEARVYQKFFTDICALKHKVTQYMRHQSAAGALVIGLGASTKGNVLLQFFGIDNTLMPYISERNPEKVGRRTLGTDIELVSEAQARAMQPGCMLVLIWFFKDELLRREQAYLAAGGRLLFPMPYCHVVSQDGVIQL